MKKNRSFLLTVVSVLILAQITSLGWQKQDKNNNTKSSQHPAKQGEVKAKEATVDSKERLEEKARREKAILIIEAMAGSNDIENKLESAHMQIDLASLVCAHGEKARAIQIFRKSMADIAEEILSADRQDRQDSSEYQELASRVADSASNCDQTLRTWFLKELDRLRDRDLKQKENESQNEPPVVPEETWGTKPSLRRQISAEILAKAAHESLTAGKIEESKRLLENSLNYCLTIPFVTALIRLKNIQPDVAYNLYIEAARRVQITPSGAEVGALKFGLRPVLGVRAPQEILASGKQPVIEAFLNAVMGLIRSPYASIAAKSPDILRMIKDTIPLFASFQPQAQSSVEIWLASAAKDLSPYLAGMVERVPFNSETPEQSVSRLEDIAHRAIDARERDRAYASIASTYLGNAKLEQANKYISRIVDESLKAELLDEFHFHRISSELNEATDMLSLFQDLPRVSSYTLRIKLCMQFAAAASKKDPYLARQALDDAVKLATEKLDSSKAQTHLLFAVASLYSEFDSVRAFEVLIEAAKSVNKHRDQPASRWGRAVADLSLVKYDHEWKFSRRVLDDPAQYDKPYDLSAFKKLSSLDLDKALFSASYIEDKSLQANAKYEICSGVLLNPQTSKEKPPNHPR